MSPAALVVPATGALLDDARSLLRRGRVRLALDLLVPLHLEPDPLLHPADRVTLVALLLDCHLAQGHLDAALSLGDELAALGDHPEAHHARAELAAALGEPDLALDRFLAAGEAGCDDDGLAPWRAGAALAMARLGRRTEALELARAQHDLALRCGDTYDVALALRVLAAADPDDQRMPRLRRALALLADVEADRLRAQVETDLAGLLLLEGRRDQAVLLLRDAEAYCAREDLWPLQSRVRRLLERLGEEPRRQEAETLAVLTAAERRVALLALDGHTNRRIADQLAVSVKAVEGHLSRVYRKLGVSSRAELVAAVDR